MRNDTLSSIPVFIINLPHSTDRKVFIKSQCKDLGVSPIFISAVNGEDLTESEIHQYYDQEKAKKFFGRELLLGEIGCALSHKKIYQKIIDENIPYAVILEDDAVIKEGFSEAVKLILALDVIWDLILLGHNKGFEKGKEIGSIKSFWSDIELDNKFKIGRVVKGGLGAFGYIVSNNGAKELLDYIDLKKIIFPIDKTTSNSRIIKNYGLFPSVVTVDMNFESMIDNDNLRDDDRQGELVYEIAMLVKKTPLFNLIKKLWFIALKAKPIRKYK